MSKKLDIDYSHILMVDDDLNVIKLLSGFLKNENFDVTGVESGEAALEEIKEKSYDLVISDLNLPGINGIEILEAAKRKNKHTQVLILTGYGSIDSAVRAMQKGAYEYLTKPIDGSTFLYKVKKALERRFLGQLIEEQQTRLDQYHRLISRDLALAKQVQASLVPKYLDLAEIETSVEYLPMMGLGGDFADIYSDSQGRVYLTVTDVTGHGVSAALIVNRVCSEIRKLVRDGLEPAQMLYALNTFFCESFDQTSMFLTCQFIRIDTRLGEILYSASAHPAALLCKRGENQILELPSQNIIIGFEKKPEKEFVQNKISYTVDDFLLMYTDGVIEAENADKVTFGLEALKKTMIENCQKSSLNILKAIVKRVESHSNGNFKDDIILLITRLKK
ncbi:SpoIIE family protein phosphatase [candidate division KSB1 bacterium]|nr:SpoIIE family protein phosphatase [candidate division KSB1 bacterium]